MANKVEIEVVAIDKASKAFGDISKGILEMGGGASKLGLAFSLAATAVAAFSKAFEYGKIAAGNERLINSGEQLAASYGESMDTIISKVKEASLGTVSDMEIITSANKAMMLGVGGNAEQLANLMEIAAMRGRAMGISTSQAFDDMARGIGRMSPMILDNLGIILDAKTTYGDYAESIGKTATELTRAEKIQALLNKVLDEGNKQLAATGGLVKDNAAAYEKFGAELTNTKNYLIATTSEMARFADMGGDALIAFRELADNGIGYGNEKLNAWSLLVGLAEKRVALMNARIEAQNSLISNSTPGYIAMAQSIEETARATDEYNAAMAESQPNMMSMISLTQQLDGVTSQAAQGIAYNMLMTKLSVDGLTQAEYELGIQAGVSMGIFSQKTADTTLKIDKMTQMVADGKLQVELLKAAIDQLESKNIDINVAIMGAAALGFQNAQQSAQAANPDRTYSTPGRAAGGSVTAGRAYTVGEVGRELFVPSQNGRIIPNNQLGGNGGGITVNLTYAPAFSMADRNEVQSKLMPFIIQGIREARLG